jgi:hypothetical protein
MTVTDRALLTAVLRPATVAIHDDRDMRGEAGEVDGGHSMLCGTHREALQQCFGESS